MKYARYLRNLVRDRAESAGVYAFGNQAGIGNNVAGRLAMHRARRAGGTRADQDDTRELARNGCYRLPYVIDAGLMAAIRSDYERALADEAQSQGRANKKARALGIFFSRELKDVLASLPLVRELLAGPLSDFLRRYFGVYEILDCAAWRNNWVPASVSSDHEVFSDHWHFDAETVDVLKIFIPLRDISEDDGPLHVQPRARSRWLVRHGFANRRYYGVENDTLDDPAHVVRFVAPAGTIMLCHTSQCLHRAGIPSEGRHRDMIQFQVVAAPPGREKLRANR